MQGQDLAASERCLKNLSLSAQVIESLADAMFVVASPHDHQGLVHTVSQQHGNALQLHTSRQSH